MVTTIIMDKTQGAALGAYNAAAKLHLKLGGYTAQELPGDCDSLNITVSDGTVFFGSFTPTGRVPLLCKEEGKPFLILKEYQQANTPHLFRLWVERNHIKTLNVVGSSQGGPGMQAAVERFLWEVLPSCR